MPSCPKQEQSSRRRECRIASPSQPRIKKNQKKTLVNEIASSQWSGSSRCCLNNQNKVASNRSICSQPIYLVYTLAILLVSWEKKNYLTIYLSNQLVAKSYYIFFCTFSTIDFYHHQPTRCKLYYFLLRLLRPPNMFPCIQILEFEFLNAIS